MRLELAKTLVSRPEFLILDEPTNHLDLISIEWLESYLQTFRVFYSLYPTIDLF